MSRLNQYSSEDQLRVKAAWTQNISRAKEAKARAKADAEVAGAREEARVEEARLALSRDERLPAGVGVSIRKRGDASELVVAGLKDEQLRRILPGINKEVMIAVTEERSAFRAGAMRFVREGFFQTIVKIVAGLVVGYLLIRFGLR